MYCYAIDIFDECFCELHLLCIVIN